MPKFLDVPQWYGSSGSLLKAWETNPKRGVAQVLGRPSSDNSVSNLEWIPLYLHCLKYNAKNSGLDAVFFAHILLTNDTPLTTFAALWNCLYQYKAVYFTDGSNYTNLQLAEGVSFIPVSGGQAGNGSKEGILFMGLGGIAVDYTIMQRTYYTIGVYSVYTGRSFSSAMTFQLITNSSGSDSDTSTIAGLEDVIIPLF